MAKMRRRSVGEGRSVQSNRPGVDLLEGRLKEWMGETVVVDCVSPFVVIGELAGVTAAYLELVRADMHDLRDTETTRELYLAKTAEFGVQKNRKRVVLRMTEVVGVSRLADLEIG